MTKYETTQDILDYFNPAKRLEKAETAFAKMTKAREKERQAKEQERQAKEQERQAKEQERSRLEKSILLMLSKGIEADLVAETIGIPISEVMDIYNKNKIDLRPNSNHKNASTAKFDAFFILYKSTQCLVKLLF